MRSSLVVSGYRIGGVLDNDAHKYEKAPVTSNRFKIPAPNRITSAHKLAVIPGLDTGSKYKTNATNILSSMYRVSGEDVIPTSLIDLGTYNELYSNNETIPYHAIYQIDPCYHNVVYCGNDKPSNDYKLTVLLDF